MDAVAPPSLSAEERAAFDRGVSEFNAGLFFQCHDTLEDLWSGVRGPSRDFFQGLIQVAVGFHHLGNGNLVGADRVLGRALGRLDGYPSEYGGVDLQALRAGVVEGRRRLQEGTVGEGERLEPPRIRLLPEGTGR